MLTVGSIDLATKKTVEDRPSDSEWTKEQKRLINELNSKLIVNAVEKRHRKPNKKEEKHSEKMLEKNKHMIYKCKNSRLLRIKFAMKKNNLLLLLS